MAKATRGLTIHGCRIRVESEYQSVLSHVDHDFHYFLNETSDTEPDFVCTVQKENTPPWKPLFTLGSSTIYWSPPGKRRVRFFRAVHVEYEYSKGHCTIYSQDGDVAYEVCYLALLSFCGEWLGRRGKHRIHAMAFSQEGRGTLLLAPSGTGKSTLAWEMVQGQIGLLLSDDIPFVDATSTLSAFPQRIALREPISVDARYVRKFRRQYFGEKNVISSAAFTDRLTSTAPIDRVVLLGQASGNRSHYSPLPRSALVAPLFRWLVLGLETPQVWELFLRFSPSDIFWKSKILVSRLWTALQILRRSKVFQFDASANTREALSVLVENR